MLRKEKTIQVPDYSGVALGTLNREFHEMLNILKGLDLDIMLYSDVMPLKALVSQLHYITEEYCRRYGVSALSLDELCTTPLHRIKRIENKAKRKEEWELTRKKGNGKKKDDKSRSQNTFGTDQGGAS